MSKDEFWKFVDVVSWNGSDLRLSLDRSNHCESAFRTDYPPCKAQTVACPWEPVTLPNCPVFSPGLGASSVTKSIQSRTWKPFKGVPELRGLLWFISVWRHTLKSVWTLKCGRTSSGRPTSTNYYCKSANIKKLSFVRTKLFLAFSFSLSLSISWRDQRSRVISWRALTSLDKWKRMSVNEATYPPSISMGSIDSVFKFLFGILYAELYYV